RLFDAAMEHIIPPFTVIFGISVGLTIATILIYLITTLFPIGSVGSTILSAAVTLSIFSVAAQVVYLLSGLFLVNAPRSIYFSLLKAPGYIFWKLFLYIRVLFGQQQDEWIRTARNE
ncbi:MAG: hypothetical protein AAF633_11830, partial [Chloroflexota bacterium]